MSREVLLARESAGFHIAGEPKGSRPPTPEAPSADSLRMLLEAIGADLARTTNIAMPVTVEVQLEEGGEGDCRFSAKVYGAA